MAGLGLLTLFFLCAQVWADPAPASDGAEQNPFTPFHAKFSLVAGSGEAGYRDGHFLDADFRHPSGMALSKDGACLYVADTGNHAIRSISLIAGNEVSTLVGNGAVGATDGAGTAARLSSPSQLALSGDGLGLWVLDQAGQALRYIDLPSASIRTLAQAPPDTTLTSLALIPSDAEGSTDDAVFLEGQGKLYQWRGRPSGAGPVLNAVQAPALDLLGQDPGLNCEQGRLVAMNHTLYFCNPCNGNVYTVKIPFTVSPTVPMQLSNTALGFGPFEEKTGIWKILFWDPPAATFARLDPVPGGLTFPFPLSDYQGTQLTGPSADLVGINATSDRRLLLHQDVCLLGGPAGLFYVADGASNRVIGVDTQLFFENGADAGLIRHDEFPKPSGTIRIAVIGNSLSYFWRAYQPEKRLNVNLSFVRELELQLNFESALRGLGKHYEVLPWVTQQGGMTGGTATYFLGDGLGDHMRHHQIDEVLIQIDYMSLWKEISAFLYNRTQDDLAVLPPQADWWSMDGKARYKELGPLTRSLMDWVRAHPDESRGVAHLDAKGLLVFDLSDRDLLGVPFIREFAVAVMRKALLKCQSLAKSQGADLGIILLPTRDLVEIGEDGGDDYYDHINHAWMDKPLSDMAASIGVACYDLTEPTRLVALPFYPLVEPGDHHYTPRGQGWLAELLARQITGSLPVYTPDRSTP